METNEECKEKISGLAMVEDEASALRQRLVEIKNNLHEVVYLIKFGNNATTGTDEKEDERSKGETRFAEIHIILKEDCRNNICNTIQENISELIQMIK